MLLFYVNKNNTNVLLLLDTDGASSSRMAAQLIEALKEAEDLEQLESNWSVKQNVEETIKFLHQVIFLF